MKENAESYLPAVPCAPIGSLKNLLFYPKFLANFVQTCKIPASICPKYPIPHSANTSLCSAVHFEANGRQQNTIFQMPSHAPFLTAHCIPYLLRTSPSSHYYVFVSRSHHYPIPRAHWPTYCTAQRFPTFIIFCTAMPKHH